ncbi:MAG: EFR1 family ferrodoxin [Parabacteroides sp.]|nr:EFR1 family ferrodoxin [Parabacteroides sp.]
MGKFEKVIIFYFSGTGNARMIASWFSKFAIENEVYCRIFDITSEGYIYLKEIDSDALIVFISPVHGFNYPKITLDFIRSFPKGNNSVVLMNTRAGMKVGKMVIPGLTGIAFFLSSSILKRKGYKTIGQIPFDMPSNWLSIHPALRKKAIEFIYEKNYHRVKKHFKILYSEETDFASNKDIIQDLLISPIALIYYLAGRYFLAKSYYASNKCNNCHLCIKQCPVQAIRLINARPFWSFKCESCMKCMNNCPSRAIEVAHGLWLVLIVLASTTGSFLFRDWLPNTWIVRFLFFNLIFFILLLVLYRVQHWILNNKLIAQIISLTSLTHYKCWGRYKANQNHQEQI